MPTKSNKQYPYSVLFSLSTQNTRHTCAQVRVLHFHHINETKAKIKSDVIPFSSYQPFSICIVNAFCVRATAFVCCFGFICLLLFVVFIGFAQWN